MVSNDRDVSAILEFFPELRLSRAAAVCQPRPAGLSGGQIWRATIQGKFWAVRRWNSAFPLDRLRWIQDILAALPPGLPFPRPIQTTGGQRFAVFGGSPWTIEAWLPGQADFQQNPSVERLTAALQTLAKFHAAVEHLGRDDEPIPAVTDRIEALMEHRRRLPEYHAALTHHDGPMRAMCKDILAACEPQISPRLAELHGIQNIRVKLFPVIRDIWHDHVLFHDNRLSGFVDFGAMRMDHRATDVARLVGSLVGDDRSAWDAAIKAYRQVAPFSDRELEWALTLDASSVVVAGLNWIHWLFVETRRFENVELVRRRVNEIAARLQARSVGRE